MWPQRSDPRHAIPRRTQRAVCTRRPDAAEPRGHRAHAQPPPPTAAALVAEPTCHGEMRLFCGRPGVGGSPADACAASHAAVAAAPPGVAHAGRGRWSSRWRASDRRTAAVDAVMDDRRPERSYRSTSGFLNVPSMGLSAGTSMDGGSTGSRGSSAACTAGEKDTSGGAELSRGARRTSRGKYAMSYARDGGPVGTRACGCDAGGGRYTGPNDQRSDSGPARKTCVSATPPSNSSTRRTCARRRGSGSGSASEVEVVGAPRRGVTAPVASDALERSGAAQPAECTRGRTCERPPQYRRTGAQRRWGASAEGR